MSLNPLSNLSDEDLTKRFRTVYADLHGTGQDGEDDGLDWIMANPKITVETRAFRCQEGYRIFLLLTPWVLMRVLVEEREEIWPEEWPDLPQQDGSDPVALGPVVEMPLLGTRQKVHLQFHPQLGRYLVQPLVLSLESYAVADEVFDAWGKVIQTRDAVIRKHNMRCQWQHDVSRREMFRGLFGGKSSGTPVAVADDEV